MASGKVYGGSNVTVLLQNDRLPCSSELLESLWVHPSNTSFQGSKSLVDFQGLDKEDNVVDEEYEVACFHQPGKKRRLKSEQVQFLERNFELENKLEPERKVQLAKELGLQPRQVAIWFQNRRARFKTKQLEKDYGALKTSYDKLKGDYDNLLHENEKLKDEVNSLKNRLISREKEKENTDDQYSSPDDANSPHKEPLNLISGAVFSDHQKVTDAAVAICKQEDANSAKSDVFDSDSPHYTDGNHSNPILEHADSSHALEPDHSDFSQDDDDDPSESLLTLPYLPKVEEVCYDEPTFVEDQTFCFWPY